MKDIRCSYGLLLVLVSCAGASDAYADKSAVTAAQGSWCQALAKASGASDNWEHLTACKAAYPTGSASYLRGMTKCFPSRRESYGKSVPDSGQLVAECRDEVTFKMAFDEGSLREVLAAHCERAARCEDVSIPDCMTGLKKLESSQRAFLYGMYNKSALQVIAACLESSACQPDEDTARAACFKDVEGKALWFP